ncbi:MAG TPA: phospholipase A, partial [Ramlibacter sp.]
MPRILPLLQCAAAAALLPLASPAAAQDANWQACSAIGAAADRLACFDRWAETQRGSPAPAPARAVAPAASALESPVAAAPTPPPVTTGPWRNLRLTTLEGCHDTNYSQLSRYWELEPGSDCGTFGIRGYRPLTLALVTADSVNRRPSSDNPANTATRDIDYRQTETRLQLSVRTKVAQGLLRPLAPQGTDSLWVGYTQQSYWQV